MEISKDFFDVEFNKSALFGYKPEEVDAFVTEALRIVREQQKENEKLVSEKEALLKKLDRYVEEEDSMRAALMGAQKLGDSLLKDSKNKAEIIIRDATTKADRIVSAAHNEKVREEEALELMRKEATDFKERLIESYRAHLEVIKNISDGTVKKGDSNDDEDIQENYPEEPVYQDIEELEPETTQFVEDVEYIDQPVIYEDEVYEDEVFEEEIPVEIEKETGVDTQAYMEELEAYTDGYTESFDDGTVEYDGYQPEYDDEFEGLEDDDLPNFVSRDK